MRPCALVLAALAFCGAAPAADEIELSPIRVSEHVWYFRGDPGMASQANRGFMSNAGFAVTGDGVVVFDALGSPALGEAMVRAIRTVTASPIRRVIVSHYHADHFYGLQAFKAAGAEVWASRKGKAYLDSDLATERLAQRRADLFPWVDERTRLVPADRWLDFDGGREQRFTLGGMRFAVIDVGGAHAPDDTMLWVEDDRTLFAGDVFFTGRIPFVGTADSKAWLAALDRVFAVRPVKVIPGHGEASDNPERDLALTREYLTWLRDSMAAGVRELKTFDEAYADTDWSRFSGYPAFQGANRINAYGVFLQMERESLGGK